MDKFWAFLQNKMRLRNRGSPGRELAAFGFALFIFVQLTMHHIIVPEPARSLPSDYSRILDDKGDKALLSRATLEQLLRSKSPTVFGLTFFDGLQTIAVETNDVNDTRLVTNADVYEMRKLAQAANVHVSDLPAVVDPAFLTRVSIWWLLFAGGFVAWFAKLLFFKEGEDETDASRFTLLCRRSKQLFEKALAKTGLPRSSLYKGLLVASLAINAGAYYGGYYHHQGTILPPYMKDAELGVPWQVSHQLNAHPEAFVRITFVDNASTAYVVRKGDDGGVRYNTVVFGQSGAEKQPEFAAFVRAATLKNIETTHLTAATGPVGDITTPGMAVMFALLGVSVLVGQQLLRKPDEEDGYDVSGRVKVYAGGDGSSSSSVSRNKGDYKRGAKAIPKQVTTFEDVAGVDEAKAELELIVWKLSIPNICLAAGAPIPRGIALYGIPGTGKTTLARAMAFAVSHNCYFEAFSGSDFVEVYAGTGAKRLRDAWAKGRAEAIRRGVISFIFIDEVDALARARRSNSYEGGKEYEQTVNALLSLTDGFENDGLVVLIVATNRLDVLDPAFLRPGRVDVQVEVPAPDRKGRIGVFNVYLKKRLLALKAGETYEQVVDELARLSPDFTGAEIKNSVDVAATLALKREFGGRKEDITPEDLLKPEWQELRIITSADLHQGVEQTAFGLRVTSKIRPPQERWLACIHELGHAATAPDPVENISIVRTGKGGLARVNSIPEDADRLTWSAAQLRDRIVFKLGGRAAELVIFNARSAGAHDDLMTAGQLARRMVGALGMCEEFGNVALPLDDNGFPVGNIGERLREEFNRHWIKLLKDCEEEAEERVRSVRARILRTARVLFFEETLKGKQFRDEWEKVTLENTEPDPSDLLPPAA